MKIWKNRTVAAAAAVAVSAALGALVAAPAQAATAHITLSKWEAFHFADSQVSQIRHWDVANGRTVYANWANRGAYSRQASCWSGVTTYGAQAG